MPNTRKKGQEGEEKGIVYLKKQGYSILDRNVYSRYGEIDAVAKEQEDLVFLEIKYRRSSAYGAPEDSIDKRKQSKIVRASIHYMKAKGLVGANVRFDVLLIGPHEGTYTLIRSAFEADPAFTC